MEFEVVADYACDTGEGPLWDAQRGVLFWIGIYDGRLYRYDPSTGESTIVYEDGVVGGATIQRDGSVLLFREAGEIVRLEAGETTTVVDEVPTDTHTRYNDCIAGPRGRAFCGTKGTEDGPGRLYRLDTDGSLSLVLDGLGLSNGMGFSPDCTRLYHTDSSNGTLYQLDYNEGTGRVWNRRPFVDVSDEDGMPDGLTVDSDGYVWSARYGGGCVVRYAPDGTEDRRVGLPVDQVTSVTFGGSEFDHLYVTTGGGAETPREPDAGALFRASAPVSGRSEFRSNV
jgi:D-xylonolactonase